MFLSRAHSSCYCFISQYVASLWTVIRRDKNQLDAQVDFLWFPVAVVGCRYCYPRDPGKPSVKVECECAAAVSKALYFLTVDYVWVQTRLVQNKECSFTGKYNLSALNDWESITGCCHLGCLWICPVADSILRFMTMIRKPCHITQVVFYSCGVRNGAMGRGEKGRGIERWCTVHLYSRAIALLVMIPWASLVGVMFCFELLS